MNYSIETPTREAYQQGGQAEMGARIDLTVYGSLRQVDRCLNIELKAGRAGLEAFRKDFEKLLREGVTGLWFHTLESASDKTWDTIEQGMTKAALRLASHADEADHVVHFAFCVLRRPQLVEFSVDFSGDWRTAFAQGFEEGRREARRPEWEPSSVPAIVPKRKLPKAFSGPLTKTFIYAPTLEPSSFLHLSTRGDSYALRSFTGARGVRRWIEDDVPTTAELRARFPIEIEIDAGSERENLDGERQYWIDRIEGLNREHGIG